MQQELRSAQEKCGWEAGNRRGRRGAAGSGPCGGVLLRDHRGRLTDRADTERGTQEVQEYCV